MMNQSRTTMATGRHELKPTSMRPIVWRTWINPTATAAISEPRAANRTTSCQELELLVGPATVECSAVSLKRRLSWLVDRQVARLGQKDNRIRRKTSAPQHYRGARLVAGNVLVRA